MDSSLPCMHLPYSYRISAIKCYTWIVTAIEHQKVGLFYGRKLLCKFCVFVVNHESFIHENQLRIDYGHLNIPGCPLWLIPIPPTWKTFPNKCWWQHCLLISSALISKPFGPLSTAAPVPASTIMAANKDDTGSRQAVGNKSTLTSKHGDMTTSLWAGNLGLHCVAL